ncbi:hypothetical protein [Streptomyces sp. NPDC020917]|uniref:hypothetical protein n=1 Tax=Streptomyces sp. NPDC020917 TaxID=3365102 RepID=UPI00379CDEC3
MADLVIDEAELQQLQSVLVQALTDVGALHRACHRMDVHAVGAAPLIAAQTTLTSTRADDLATVGRGLTDRRDQVDRVVPTMCDADNRLGRQAG